jgi:hypothetical protein
MRRETGKLPGDEGSDATQGVRNIEIKYESDKALFIIASPNA